MARECIVEQLREWLNEEIALAQEQLEKSKTESPDSYIHGCDAGIAFSLQSVLVKIQGITR